MGSHYVDRLLKLVNLPVPRAPKYIKLTNLDKINKLPVPEFDYHLKSNFQC